MSNPVPAFALLFALFAIAGCSRGAEVSRGPDERLGPGQWSVDEVRLDSAYEEIAVDLGPGKQVGFGEGSPVFKFEPQDIVVTFDAGLHARKISGQRLLRDGEVVLQTGQSEESVIEALGDGYVIRRFSPKTSGIITTGSVPLWTEHYYHDGTNRIHVFVNRHDRIGGIHTATIENLPLPK